MSSLGATAGQAPGMRSEAVAWQVGDGDPFAFAAWLLDLVDDRRQT